MSLPLWGATNKFYSADVSVSTSAKVLGADASRNYLLIQNKGTESVYMKCDTAHSGTEGIEIIAGGNYEPFEAWTCDVYLKADSGTQSVHIFSGRSN